MSFRFGGKVQSGYFKIPYKQAELHPTGLLVGGAGAPYRRFRPGKKLAALNIQMQIVEPPCRR